MKRPAKHIGEYTKSKPPKCPASGEKSPIQYSGGTIYLGKFVLRAIRKRSHYGTEKKKFGKEDADRPAAWDKSLKTIDEVERLRNTCDSSSDHGHCLWK